MNWADKFSAEKIPLQRFLDDATDRILAKFPTAVVDAVKDAAKYVPTADMPKDSIETKQKANSWICPHMKRYMEALLLHGLNDTQTVDTKTNIKIAGEFIAQSDGAAEGIHDLWVELFSSRTSKLEKDKRPLSSSQIAKIIVQQAKKEVDSILPRKKKQRLKHNQASEYYEVLESVVDEAVEYIPEPLRDHCRILSPALIAHNFSFIGINLDSQAMEMFKQLGSTNSAVSGYFESLFVSTLAERASLPIDFTDEVVQARTNLHEQCQVIAHVWKDMKHKNSLDPELLFSNMCDVIEREVKLHIPNTIGAQRT